LVDLSARLQNTDQRLSKVRTFINDMDK